MRPKLSLLHLLTDALDNDFYAYDRVFERQTERFSELRRRREEVGEDERKKEAYRADAADFARDEEARLAQIATIQEKLKHVFLFLDRTFGEGQEMVIFLTALSSGFYSKKFLHECGSVEYDKYSSVLLLQERKSALKAELMRLS